MEMTFGEKIKRLREEKNMNQTQLGCAVNMTQRKVSYLEHDQYEPSIGDIRMLCLYFNVSADYLLGFSGRQPFPQNK